MRGQIDQPLEGGLAALERVGASRTLHELPPRVEDPSWSEARRAHGLWALEQARRRVRAHGARAGGVALADPGGGGLAIVEPEASDDPTP